MARFMRAMARKTYLPVEFPIDLRDSPCCCCAWSSRRCRPTRDRRWWRASAAMRLPCRISISTSVSIGGGLLELQRHGLVFAVFIGEFEVDHPMHGAFGQEALVASAKLYKAARPMAA